MDEDSYLSIDVMKPGTRIDVIGNCVIVKFDDEDDAFLFAEILKEMDNANVFIEPKE